MLCSMCIEIYLYILDIRYVFICVYRYVGIYLYTLKTRWESNFSFSHPMYFRGPENSLLHLDAHRFCRPSFILISSCAIIFEEFPLVFLLEHVCWLWILHTSFTWECLHFTFIIFSDMSLVFFFGSFHVEWFQVVSWTFWVIIIWVLFKFSGQCWYFSVSKCPR